MPWITLVAFSPVVIFFLMPLIARTNRLAIGVRRGIIVVLWVVSIFNIVVSVVLLKVSSPSALLDAALRGFLGTLPIVGLTWSMSMAISITSQSTKTRRKSHPKSE